MKRIFLVVSVAANVICEAAVEKSVKLGDNDGDGFTDRRVVSYYREGNLVSRHIAKVGSGTPLSISRIFVRGKEVYSLVVHGRTVTRKSHGSGLLVFEVDNNSDGRPDELVILTTDRELLEYLQAGDDGILVPFEDLQSLGKLPHVQFPGDHTADSP